MPIEVFRATAPPERRRNRDFIEFGVVRGNAGSLVVILLSAGEQEEHVHDQEHVGAVLEGEFSSWPARRKRPCGRATCTASRPVSRTASVAGTAPSSCRSAPTYGGWRPASAALRPRCRQLRPLTFHPERGLASAASIAAHPHEVAVD